MFEKRLALIIFYDDENRILLQDRSNMSKWGEVWGYFGGSIDKGETPKEAIIREVSEELEFNLKNPVYLGEYVGFAKPLKDLSKDFKIIHYVFYQKITMEEYKSMVLHEGAGKKWFSIVKAKKLNMHPLDPKVFDDFEKIL